MVHTITKINFIILYYFLVISVCYLILLFTSVIEVIKRFNEIFVLDDFALIRPENQIGVTVVIPAYNEEKNILNCVQSVQHSDYKNVKIIIVNDGSTDGTLACLIKQYALTPKPVHGLESFVIGEQPRIPTYGQVIQEYVSEQYPNLLVIDKTHSGTGDTLNIGTNFVTTPLMMTLDADSLVEPSTLGLLVFAMISEPHAVTVGGGVYVLNECVIKNGVITQSRLPAHYVPGIQAVEYLRSYVFGRPGWNIFKGGLSFSGTCTLFDHKAVTKVGGFDLDNPAQDAEIVAKMHDYHLSRRLPYKILFTPAALSWTLVPPTLRRYARQRIAWQRGLFKSFSQHLHMFMNPRFGIVGCFNFPFYLLVETLGPLVELTAYLIIIISLLGGFFSVKAAVVFFCLSVGFLSLLTIATMAINVLTFNRYKKLSDLLKMFYYIVFEVVGFRQFLLVCQAIGVFAFVWRRCFPKRWRAPA